ncbi:MAG: hypothetical protein WC516_04955 [Patescibacteria group bacterium]|jgi:ribosomal protein L24E
MDKKYNRFSRREQETRKEKKEGDIKIQEKKCPYCGGILRHRGPKDGAGTVYWKCRNKKCGRTVNLKKDPPKEVIPLVYINKIRSFNG